MRSKVARATAELTSRRIAALSPAERIAIALDELREAALASYVLTHGVDRSLAIKRIKATRCLGRRASAAADER